MSKKTAPVVTKTATPVDADKKTTGWLLLKVFLVAAVFLLYGKTNNYEFTLDDDLFYLKHASVQKGLDGFSEFFSYGSLNKFDGTTGVQPYRPITLLYFGLQKQYFDNSTTAAHFFNVLLYALVVLVLLSLIKKLFPSIHPLLAGIVVGLFLVHPIHTEVVCSVKSVDELLAALFGFGAWMFFLPNEKEEKISVRGVGLASVLYFMALMSKESAISFLVILPVSIVMLKGRTWKSALLVAAPLAVVTLLFLTIRYAVIGNEPAKNSQIVLENILYGANGFGEILATKFQILYHYIKLLVAPWPLNWDYSYNQIPVATWSSLSAIGGLLIYGFIFFVAIVKFKKEPLLSFAILFFLMASAPTNNFFLINGATVGERFLFVPSLSLSFFALWLIGKYNNNMFSSVRLSLNEMAQNIAIVAIVLFTCLSYARSGDWENNQKLFERGVEVSPKSSRTHYSLATTYLNKAQEEVDPVLRKELFQKATEHFQKSLSIYNKNTQAFYNCGFGLSLTGDTTGAIYHYRKAIEYDSTYLSALNNLGVLYQARKNWDSAEVFYMMAHRTAPTAANPRKNLADLYFFKGVDYRQKGFVNEALDCYRQSMPYNDKNVFLYNELSVIKTNEKNYDSALYYLKVAIKMDPTSMLILENIAAVSFLNKSYAQAIEYANRALKINGNSKKSLGVLADTYRTMGNAAEASVWQQKYNGAR